MSGIRTTCQDNARLHRQGCTAVYSGAMVHCTAPAPWSTRPDGLCHETFSNYGTLDLHLGVRAGEFWHRDPHSVDGLRRDATGIWKRPRREGGAPQWGRSPAASPPGSPPGAER